MTVPHRVITGLVAAAVWLAGTGSEHASARAKLALIREDKAPARSMVSFSVREINAYARAEVRNHIPEGVRDPHFVLGESRVTGSAYVDFLKLRRGQGKPVSWLIARLLEGERKVEGTVRVKSGRGEAQVDVERVEVSGIRMSGAALEFLIENFVVPRYPEVKIGEPFELDHRVDRIEVKPSGVRVMIGD